MVDGDDYTYEHTEHPWDDIDWENECNEKTYWANELEEEECLRIAQEDGFDVFAETMQEFVHRMVGKALVIQSVQPIETRVFLLSLGLEILFEYRRVLAMLDPEIAEGVDHFFSTHSVR